MKILAGISLLAAFGLTYVSNAADLAPVVIIMPSDTAATPTQNYGLIGAFIMSSAAKRTGLRIKGFHDARGDIDLVAEAQKEFACIGVPEGSPCRAIEVFSG